MRKAARVLKKSIVNPRMYDALTVWAASCAAYRINNAYLKEALSLDGKHKHANKILMRMILVEPTDEHCITDADRQQADTIRNYYLCKLMEVLSGTATPFLKSAVELASREEFAANDWLGLATIASLPAGYERSLVRDKLNEQKMEAIMRSQHFGTVGDRISGTATIIDSRWSKMWEVFYTTARFENNVILFTYRTELKTGTEVEFAGTVKSHRDDNITQLNRVKIFNKT